MHTLGLWKVAFIPKVRAPTFATGNRKQGHFPTKKALVGSQSQLTSDRSRHTEFNHKAGYVHEENRSDFR